MKIAIVGSGNIGSLLGALLTAGGQDVTLVEIREEIVEAIRKEGIRIDMSDGQSKHAAVRITNSVNSVGEADLVILAVKSNATRRAAEDAKAIVGKDTWVMSVQNGAGNVETLVEVVGDASRVIGGVFWCVVTPLKVNHLSWVVGTGGLKFGPVSGALSPKVKEIADVFRKAGVSVDLSTRIQELIWSKVMQNVPMAFGTAMRMTNDEWLAYPHAKELVIRMAQECLAVTNAMGVTLDHPEDPIKPLMDTLEKFNKSGRKPKCSMLQDLERGRLTEIDAINGSIVREGKRLGVPTPVNEVMVAFVKAAEEKFCKS